MYSFQGRERHKDVEYCKALKIVVTPNIHMLLVWNTTDQNLHPLNPTISRLGVTPLNCLFKYLFENLLNLEQNEAANSDEL